MNDGEAMARIQRGDPSGLDHLVRCYQASALRVAYLIVRDAATAEDLVQTAFLRVYQRADQFNLERPFRPWFLRIVVNDALKLAAAWERQVPLQVQTVDETFALLQPGPSLDDLVVNAETIAAVWAALGALPAAQRTAVVLRYYLDLSEGEIATRMASPLGTVKSRLHAARQHLRRLLVARWTGPASGLLPSPPAKETPDESA